MIDSSSDTLLSRARSGDGAAFRSLTEPYRRELHAHCYRMLGSFHDAEDALQDTMLTAWTGLDGYEGRASLRTWLYRIATNRCLTVLRSPRRRGEATSIPASVSTASNGQTEVLWLEPYPDSMMAQMDVEARPEERSERNESMSLAYIAALQLLTARQRAVLILREVLGFHAHEVADMLDSSTESVTSALKRARATLDRHTARAAHRSSAPSRGSARERQLAAEFVEAYGRGDVAHLVALLTSDVVVSMPPIPLEYHGRVAATAFFEGALSSTRHYDMVETRANGDLAYASYYVSPSDGVRHATGLLVLGLDGDLISSITRFDSGVLASFGLPRTLPA